MVLSALFHAGAMQIYQMVEKRELGVDKKILEFRNPYFLAVEFIFMFRYTSLLSDSSLKLKSVFEYKDSF